jgi:methionyl-tRNA formyltransferase
LRIRYELKFAKVLLIHVPPRSFVTEFWPYMRIVFMGTPDFAVPTLEALIEHGHEVVGVVTMPDRQGGRAGILESAVKKCALRHNLPLLQPEKLKNAEFLTELRALRADLQVVVAFRMLPEVVWGMPPFGTMNLHGSLLPKYRGAAPINWAIINGETETGVTTFLLQHEIDSGDLMFQARTPIGEKENAGELHDRMMLIGAELVLRSVNLIEAGNFTLVPQDITAVSHAPKIFAETCKINFNSDSKSVHDFIRGLSPYPAAWTVLDGKILKVLEAEQTFYEGGEQPGGFVSDGKNELMIVCRQGAIRVLELQIEGKKRMKTRDFLMGYRI